MKLFIYSLCILAALATASGQTINPRSVDLSDYEKKIKVIEDFKSSLLNQPSEVDSKTVFRVIGGAALIGFLASVTIFKQDLFGSVPLTLLAAGIILFIISV